MDDSNQLEVPASFVALFMSRSGQRLLQPAPVVQQRYELCEDLAQTLTEQASVAQFKTGASERDVLAQMLLALTTPESPVQPAEAAWVVRRLAELLGWEAPLDQPE